MRKKRSNFEVEVINKILLCIRRNQTYLCQPENLPQLAKLGYMYNTLWYSGRAGYGSDGLISKSYQCENNPKYKIEMCNPKTPEIENLIYDAWGMHVENDFTVSWDMFNNIITGNTELTDIEKKLLKVNKTFEEWVEIKTHNDYQYKILFSNKRSVANFLFCVIGNGYGYKDGYIIEEAGGADQDISLYGDWKNAKFCDKIQEVVDKIMSNPDIKLVIETLYNFHIELEVRREKEEKEREYISFLDMFEGNVEKTLEFIDKLRNRRKQRIEEIDITFEKYSCYYPICEYSIITKLDENSHESYIKAGIEICEEILEHREEEIANNNYGQNNVDFAIKFLKRFKK
jgi:hypothetical protein